MNLLFRAWMVICSINSFHKIGHDHGIFPAQIDSRLLLENSHAQAPRSRG